MSQRRNRTKMWPSKGLFLPLLVVALGALLLAIGGAASAGPIGNASGFEDDDGNLVVNSTFDWNGFSPVTWTGSAPYQSASKTASGWVFNGLADAQKLSTDTGFAGGTKQDVDCAGVIGSSAPNKDDLKRIYIAHKTVNGHIYLMLAWVRIPQNSTSSSTHVGFEFNQGTTSCPATSDGLVRRTVGDILIVYDFAGGAAAPILTVRRWVTSGACDISNDSAPCWGVAQTITAPCPPGNAICAEAKVNTGATALDSVAPSSETLGLVEFGEAGIDLTGANIFTENQCTNFGQAEGVSRSSGNSGTAAMEDLVGPGKVTISNCPQPTMTTSASCAPPTGCPITSSGVALTDTATLSNGPSAGDGTLTFHLYTGATCSTEVAGSPVTRTVNFATATSYTSPAITVSSAGTYRWRVEYSGVPGSILPIALTPCNATGENSLVTPVQPTATTAQDLLPNDRFTLSGASNPTGSVTFTLFGPLSPGTCGASGTAAKVFGPTAVPLSGSSASTSNTTNHVTTPGTYKWFDSWPGDANNNGATSNCVETLTLSNG
jgi:hypothetical protein